MNRNIIRALISVSKKEGVAFFAYQLASRWGVEILSTGGTARELSKHNVPVKEVSAHTGFPEILDGRVKTLHPKIHGGLLGLRGNKAHVTTMAEHGIVPIDLVVVNLYPFEDTVAQAGCTVAEAVEQIDIGGPGVIRSGAKNYPSVTVVTAPEDYPRVLADMERLGGEVSLELNFELAVKAFARTSEYDATIAGWLKGQMAE